MATNDTNKTHAVKINIKGANTNSIDSNINVFIPYEDIFDNLDTNEGVLIWFARYCQAHPNLVVCNNSISVGGNQSVLIRDPIIPVNMSARDVIAMKRDIQRLADSNARSDNQIKDLLNLLSVNFPEFAKQLNDSYSKQQENEKVSDSRTRAFWIGAIFLIVCGGIIVTAFYVRRYYFKKNLLDAGYRYKW